MDISARWMNQPRTPLLLGAQGQLRLPDRPSKDERIDIPKVSESTRVSFSEGIAIHAGFPTRSGVDRYLDIARDIGA